MAIYWRVSVAAVPTPSSSAPGPNGLSAAIVLAPPVCGSSFMKPNGRSAAAVDRPSSRCPASSTTCARRSIRWPSRRRSSGRFRSPTTGSSGSSRRRCSRIRSTTGRRPWSHRSLTATAAHWVDDARRVRRLIGSVVRAWPRIEDAVLGPPRWPRHPFALARFGLSALQSADAARARHFDNRGAARAVCRHRGACHAAARSSADRRGSGWCSARSLIPPAGSSRAAARSSSPTRWPRTCDRSAARSSQAPASIVDRRPSAGAGHPVRSVAASAAQIAGARFRLVPAQARTVSLRDGRLQGRLGARWRRFRGATANVARAGTVHVGGTLEEIAQSERDAWHGTDLGSPVRAARRSRRSSIRTRAPDGKHTAWAYCHVPHGSTVDMLSRIEAQIERFAPGFRERVLARARHERRRISSGTIPNLVGGDIAAGRDRSAAVVRPPDLALVSHPGPRDLYLLGVDAARRRRSRHVRLLRRQAGASPAVGYASSSGAPRQEPG